MTNRARVRRLARAYSIASANHEEPLDPQGDRVMVCGSKAMLSDVCAMLDRRGFAISPHIGVAGDYVIERAFVGSGRSPLVQGAAHPRRR